MPDPSPDQKVICRFFAEKKIDAFSIADIFRIRAPADRHPRTILPSCQTIIIFGIELNDHFFTGTPGNQAAEARRCIDLLESTTLALRDLLVPAGSAAEAVLPLPLDIRNGTIRGRLSLKYCAAAAGLGTIGENTLLIHPVSGNRLLLAAVITDKKIEATPIPASLPACTHCHRCVAACPGGAIRDGEVLPDRCRALTGTIPRAVRPLAFRLMQGRWSAPVITAVLNLAAPHLIHRIRIPVTCTSCVTACPYFHKGGR
jgi:epoxyqueuosine reductase